MAEICCLEPVSYIGSNGFEHHPEGLWTEP
jgi:hypothetical protein